MKFYRMYAKNASENFVKPGAGLSHLIQGCMRSEFQYLDRLPVSVEIDKDGGLEFPDLIIHEDVIPLISERFRQILNRLDVDNLFCKPVTLTFALLGYSESYWLALPPRIRCLDMERCIISQEQNEFLRTDELIRKVEKIVIRPETVGNYKIFKLPAEYTNQDIIVTEEVKETSETANLSNVYFSSL